MRPVPLCSLLVGLILAGPAFSQMDKPPAFPKPGSDLPGSFSPYNVTGRKKGKFHCPVTEHGLAPAVMVIVRGEELPEGLAYLLTKLDSYVENNQHILLGGFVVFISDKLKDVVREDDPREQLEKVLLEKFPRQVEADRKREQLEEMLAVLRRGGEQAQKLADNEKVTVEELIKKVSKELELHLSRKHLTVTLDAKNDVAKYRPGDQAEVVVLLYKDYRVVSYHGLSRAELTPDKAKEILGEVAMKLGANR